MHCDGACAGCSQRPPQEILALASNTIGAQPGDFVEVEPSVGHNIGTSVVVFLLPCVGLAMGYGLGQAFLHLGDLAALGTALVGLCVGFIPAFLLNKAMTSRQTPEFAILKHLR